MSFLKFSLSTFGIAFIICLSFFAAMTQDGLSGNEKRLTVNYTNILGQQKTSSWVLPEEATGPYIYSSRGSYFMQYSSPCMFFGYVKCAKGLKVGVVDINSYEWSEI